MIKKKKQQKNDTLNFAFEQNELLQFNIFGDINIYNKCTIQKTNSYIII